MLVLFAMIRELLPKFFPNFFRYVELELVVDACLLWLDECAAANDGLKYSRVIAVGANTNALSQVS